MARLRFCDWRSSGGGKWSEVLPDGKVVAGIYNEIHSTRSFHSLGTLASSLFRHFVPYGMTGRETIWLQVSVTRDRKT